MNLPIHESCKGNVYILSCNMLKKPFTQTMWHLLLKDPQLLTKDNCSNLLHPHYSAVLGQIQGGTPVIWGEKIEHTLEPDPGALCGRGLLRAPTS